MSGIEYFIIANPILAYAIIFFGMFIEGEGLIIFSSIFAWQGHLNWWLIAGMIIGGTIAGDIMWYAGGRFLRGTRLGNWLDRRYEKHTDTLDTNIREHYGRLAVLSKFMYFTTHPTIFLVGWNKFPFKKFFVITLYATFVWALSVLGVGYFFGYAIELIGYKRFVHRIEIFAILLFLAVFVFGKIIKTAISRKARSSQRLAEGPVNHLTHEILPLGKHVPASYRAASLIAKLKAQTLNKAPKTAVFTDIDNTFYKKGFEQYSAELVQTLSKQNIPLIAVTGVHFPKVLQRIKDGELPYFDAIGSAVGTELHILNQTDDGSLEYLADQDFRARIKNMEFNRPELVRASQRLIAQLKKESPDLQLNFQSPDEESAYLADNSTPHQEFKISFHFFATGTIRTNVTKLFADSFPAQETIICEEINYNQTLPKDAPVKKYCADILPVSKAGVIAYLTTLTEIKKTVIAGDSGNDVEMLTEYTAPLATLSILVGGHTEEAVEKLKALTEKWEPVSPSTRRLTGANNQQHTLFIEPLESANQAAQSILATMRNFGWLPKA